MVIELTIPASSHLASEVGFMIPTRVSCAVSPLTILCIATVSVSLVVLVVSVTKCRHRRRLEPGDRVRLGGGDHRLCSTWLSDPRGYQGEVTAFVAVTASPPAAMLRLDEPVVARGISSRFLLLHLRSDGVWTSRGVVAVELLGVPLPLDRSEPPGSERWIADSATYQRIERAVVRTWGS